MNWFIIALDIMFALIAAALGILGHRTFKSIKHLGIGKFFWIPVFISGIIFLIGATVNIFHEFAVEYNFVTLAYTEEIIRISWLLAITVLFSSIYNYSRKVTTAIQITTPQDQKETELSELKKQTNELLKQIEKLKTKQN